MSQDFTENKRYLLNFEKISWGIVIILLMVVSYWLGYAACMRVAVDKGCAEVTENGWRWGR